MKSRKATPAPAIEPQHKTWNIMHGIAIYRDPWSELSTRVRVASYLLKVAPKDRVPAISNLVQQVGRETVRAVVGDEAA